jgi:uncharacterized membrane protein
LTIITGLITAYLNGYVHEALAFKGGAKNITIGIGMWLGIIMAINVWFIIWPNQKRALGIVESARIALLVSRTNTFLSIPMLLTMVTAQNLY